MNWKFLRPLPWLDTRARFLSSVPHHGTVLDIGSSDGSTLSHFYELRQDLHYFATDVCGEPDKYPLGTVFHRADITKDRLPWENGRFDAITCMHLIEHIETYDNLLREISRLLKQDAKVYFETPRPLTAVLDSPKSAQLGRFTSNFFDDPTHQRIVSAGRISSLAHEYGLRSLRSGVSRNWLFSLAYLLYVWLPESRSKLTSYVHFRGWSAYLICSK